MTDGDIWLMVALCVLGNGALLLDLASHKSGKTISIGNAIAWSCAYVAAALIYSVLVLAVKGQESFALFLTGYALEKMLSVDNLVVFMAIFSYFNVQAEHQHKILHLGILGAVVIRLAFVAVGTSALWLFGPVAETAFAAIILYTAYAMALAGDGAPADYDNAWYVVWTKKFLPVTGETDGSRLFIGRKATPLFICLIAIELSDVAFAFDSVPAIIAVTRDPILIYSAMVFALMGLRSLYFVIAALKAHLHHLEKAIILVLVLFAGKLLLHAWAGIKVDPVWGLAAILVILTAGVVASMAFPSEKPVSTTPQ
jgi:tellurite resistance protein TerC